MNKQLLAVIEDEVHFRSMEPVLSTLRERSIDFSVFYYPGYTPRNPTLFSDAVIDSATALKASWKFIVSSNPVDRNVFKGHVISIAHGVMFGNNAWSLNRALNADTYCGFSPAELSYITHHLRKRFDPSRFIATGSPVSDALHRQAKRIENSGGAARREKKIAIGLDPDRETVVLASHWTSSGNLRVFGGALIDAIHYNYPGYQIIVTAHPHIWSSPKEEFFIDHGRSTADFEAGWLRRMLLDKEKALPVKVLFDESPKDFIFVADLFVGDFSSVMIEAAAFDIPLITRCEGYIYERMVHRLIRKASDEFKNLEQLIAAVGNCRRAPDERKQGRSELRDVFLYNAGGASAKISDVITELMAR